jgi:hypothetical protein
VQVPKVRTAPRDERRTRMILLAVVGSALALVAVVAGFLLLSGGGSANSGTIATLREAGCSYQNPKEQGRDHVAVVPRNYKANSVPRSSGPHSSQTLIWGTYTEVVPEINAVHNLEHGGVIIWFGPKVSQATIGQINALYIDDPNGLIVGKHPKLGDDIALVAWTHVARCPRFNEDAVNRFIDAFRAKGPEPFEVSDLQPGEG